MQARGAVVHDAENRLLVDVGQVEAPDEILGRESRSAVLNLASKAEDLKLALPNPVGDVGLTDRHASPSSPKRIERGADLSAAGVGHQSGES